MRLAPPSRASRCTVNDQRAGSPPSRPRYSVGLSGTGSCLAPAGRTARRPVAAAGVNGASAPVGGGGGGARQWHNSGQLPAPTGAPRRDRDPRRAEHPLQGRWRSAAEGADAVNTELPVCPLCERPIPAPQQERHHLVPKSRGGRETAYLHRVCHRQIHALFTETELARQYASAEALLQNPEIRSFVAWVKTKPDGFFVATRKSRRVRGRP